MIEPTIFLGPPGTGKTTKLLDVVLMEMERGIPPDRIGFMTFTKRGVEEAISRAAERFKISRQQFRYFNTLHSAAFRYLGLNSSQVFTGKQIEAFCTTFPQFRLSGHYYSDDGTYSRSDGDDLAMFLDNYARITEMPLEKVLDNAPFFVSDTSRIMNIVKTVRLYKKEQGLYDFTDMLEEFNRYDSPPVLDVLIIDEAQDLSELQWRMVEILARHVKRAYIAGDDDQSIFLWAGASSRFIDLPGKVEFLKQSWRVPIDVHRLANKIISQVRKRREKIWKPRPEQGSLEYINELGALDPAIPRTNMSIMMLARTGKMLRKVLVPYCRINGIPYLYFDIPSIRNSYATAITAWEWLHQGKQVNITDITRIYDLLPSDTHGMRKGVARGAKTLLKRMAENQDISLTLSELRQEYGLQAEGTWDQVFTEIHESDIKYIHRVRANGFNILDNPRIHISTIHRVKGGQADIVILMSDQDKKSQDTGIRNPDEEIRVFYTAATRTFKDLIVIQPIRTHYFAGLFP